MISGTSETDRVTIGRGTSMTGEMTLRSSVTVRDLSAVPTHYSVTSVLIVTSVSDQKLSITPVTSRGTLMTDNVPSLHPSWDPQRSL